MVEIDRDTGIKVGAGLFLFVIIAAFLIVPYAFPADTIILTNPQGGTPVSCLPSGGLVLAQNLTDLCDVTIISPLTTQIIEYNGTQWVNVNVSQVFNDTTTCGNIGTGSAFICVEGSNVDLRSLLAGTGISVSNNTNTITITNTAPDNTVCTNVGAGSEVYKDGECNFRTLTEGTSIDLTQNANDISITNTAPDNTACANLGTVGEGVYVSGECNFKKLLAGSGISLSANGTRITFTNTLPESTACNNVGTGNQLCSGGNVNIDTLIAGTGITITDTTDDWTFASQCANTGTGEAVCESSNNINSLISADTNTLTITDTTGDLTFTPTLQKLCEATASGGETSLTCTLSNSVQRFWITASISTADTSTTFRLRFNGDTGANYVYRSSLNGAADSTTAASYPLLVTGTTASRWQWLDMTCQDIISSQEKHCYGFHRSSANGSGNADSRTEIAYKWANTANDITTVDIQRSLGTGTLEAGNTVAVWGYS